jgi:signal transduction histidine kinase
MPQLCRYINNLLDVTRLETVKMSIEFQALPLAAMIEQVVEMLAPAAAGKGVSLNCDCQTDLPAGPIDRQRILGAIGLFEKPFDIEKLLNSIDHKFNRIMDLLNARQRSAANKPPER